MNQPPTQAQVEFLAHIQAEIRSVEDRLHDLRHPDGRPSVLGKALADINPSGAGVGITLALDAILYQLASLEYQVTSFAFANGVRMLTTMPTVYHRADARRRARSLPPEKDEEPAEGDAGHTAPVLEATAS
jgi:hypothetical protein